MESPRELRTMPSLVLPPLGPGMHGSQNRQQAEQGISLRTANEQVGTLSLLQSHTRSHAHNRRSAHYYGMNVVNEGGVLKRIPRPRNAFMIFASEHRRRFHEMHPEVANGEISVKLGDAWHTLPTEVKKHYFARAKEEEKEHRRKYPFYQYRPSGFPRKMRRSSSGSAQLPYVYQRQLQCSATPSDRPGMAATQTCLHILPSALTNKVPQLITQPHQVFPTSNTVDQRRSAVCQDPTWDVHSVSMHAQHPWHMQSEQGNNLSSVPDMLRPSKSVMTTEVNSSVSCKLFTPQDLKGQNQSTLQSMKICTGFRSTRTNSSSTTFNTDAIAKNRVSDGHEDEMGTFEANDDALIMPLKAGVQEQRRPSETLAAKQYRLNGSGNHLIHLPDMASGLAAVEIGTVPAHMYTTKAIYQNGRVMVELPPAKRSAVKQEIVEVLEERSARPQGTVLSIPEHDQPCHQPLLDSADTMDNVNNPSFAGVTGKRYKQVQLPSIDEWAFSTNQLATLLPQGLGVAPEAGQITVSAGFLLPSLSAIECGKNSPEGEQQQGPLPGLETLTMASASTLNSDKPPASGPNSSEESPGAYRLPESARLIGRGNTTDSNTHSSLDSGHGRMDWKITRAPDGHVLYSSQISTGTAAPQRMEIRGDHCNSHADKEDDGTHYIEKAKDAKVQKDMKQSPMLGRCISEAIKTIIHPQEAAENLVSHSGSACSPEAEQREEDSQHKQCRLLPLANLGTSTYLTKVYSQPLTCPSSGCVSGSSYGHHYHHSASWKKPKPAATRLYLGNPSTSTSRYCRYGQMDQADLAPARNKVSKHMEASGNLLYQSYTCTDSARMAHTHMESHYQHHLRTCCSHPLRWHPECSQSEHLHGEQSSQECPYQELACHEDAPPDCAHHEHLKQPLLSPIPGYSTAANKCSLHAAQPVVYLPCHPNFASCIGLEPKGLPTPEHACSYALYQSIVNGKVPQALQQQSLVSIPCPQNTSVITRKKSGALGTVASRQQVSASNQDAWENTSSNGSKTKSLSTNLQPLEMKAVENADHVQQVLVQTQQDLNSTETGSRKDKETVSIGAHSTSEGNSCAQSLTVELHPDRSQDSADEADSLFGILQVTAKVSTSLTNMDGVFKKCADVKTIPNEDVIDVE